MESSVCIERECYVVEEWGVVMEDMEREVSVGKTVDEEKRKHSEKLKTKDLQSEVEELRYMKRESMRDVDKIEFGVVMKGERRKSRMAGKMILNG